jgi:hypothetical protein
MAEERSERSEYVLVVHVHEFEDGSEDMKIIGLYRTEERARAAVARALPLPGFRDAPDGFSVVPYTLDVDGWTEGYTTEY